METRGSDEKRGCDGDARKRWRSEAASNGGAQTTESDRDFAMRERSRRRKTKVSKSFSWRQRDGEDFQHI
ncbi:hypothetical protein Syun_012237 [Stephania yunnanensis]|uniref:Uncharacterized protein n=1 Tax=Stephania yunnanensis TaxID=152371 RepID=A0AAP0PG86_9MAGN